MDAVPLHQNVHRSLEIRPPEECLRTEGKATSPQREIDSPFVKDGNQDLHPDGKGKVIQGLSDEGKAVPLTIERDSEPNYEESSKVNEVIGDINIKQEFDDSLSSCASPYTASTDEQTESYFSQNSDSPRQPELSESSVENHSFSMHQEPWPSSSYNAVVKKEPPDYEQMDTSEGSVNHEMLIKKIEQVSALDSKDLPSDSEIPAAIQPSEECRNSLECPECGEHFVWITELIQHRTKHMLENPQMNNTEIKDNGSSEIVDKSMDTAESENFAKDKPHKCEECSKSFLTSFKLKQHMMVHTGEKPYGCPECGKRFSQNGNLQAHRQLHTGQKPFKCDDCGRCFVLKTLLQKHRLTHSDAKPFVCPQCGKDFARACYLKKHMVLHTGVRAHECPECGRCFARDDTLKDHLRTHTGEKPYKCELCGKECTQSSNLRDHMLTHSGEKQFKCPHCGKEFARNSDVQRHILTHTGVKPHICPICNKGFTLSSGLKRHLPIHTTVPGEFPHVCEVCSKGFSLPMGLRRHMLANHRELVKPNENQPDTVNVPQNPLALVSEHDGYELPQQIEDASSSESHSETKHVEESPMSAPSQESTINNRQCQPDTVNVPQNVLVSEQDGYEFPEQIKDALSPESRSETKHVKESPMSAPENYSVKNVHVPLFADDPSLKPEFMIRNFENSESNN